MTERLINVQIHWSEPTEEALRAFVGVTIATRNEDGSDPPPVYCPKDFLDARIVAALEATAIPALTAARKARLDALEPAEQRAARLKEEAEAERARLDEEIATKASRVRELDAEIATKEAAAADTASPVDNA